MTQQTYFFDTRVQWVGRRRGNLQAKDLPDLVVSTPPEFKGEAGCWTPEHFFVAAAEVCLMATFIGIAENSRLAVGNYRSTARGQVESAGPAGLRFTELRIFPVVELERAEDRERAGRIMDKAAKNCLVANSLSASVEVEATFVLKDAGSAL